MQSCGILTPLSCIAENYVPWRASLKQLDCFFLYERTNKGGTVSNFDTTVKCQICL